TGGKPGPYARAARGSMRSRSLASRSMWWCVLAHARPPALMVADGGTRTGVECRRVSCGGSGREQPRELRRDEGVLDEERIVPEGRGDHDRLRPREAVGEVLGDRALARDGEETVTVDAEHEPQCGRPSQRRRDPVAIPADVVRVHRLDEHEVAVGVEPPRELVAVEVEVALDGEAAAPAHRVETALPTARETVVELARGAVVDERHAPGEREAAVRALAVVGTVVVAALERRIH